MSRILCALVLSLGLLPCAMPEEHEPASAATSQRAGEPATAQSIGQEIETSDRAGQASDPASASAPAASAPLAAQAHRITDMLTRKFGLARAKAEQISAAVMSSASKYSLPPALVLAIISIESRFREKAKGAHGATGLMQVVPAAHKRLVEHIDLTEPAANIEAGSAILHGYIESARGDVDAALKSYGGSKAYAQQVGLRAKELQPSVAASDTDGAR
jgi:soluble lytic murein transglycosylase-like protein